MQVVSEHVGVCSAYCVTVAAMLIRLNDEETEQVVGKFSLIDLAGRYLCLGVSESSGLG